MITEESVSQMDNISDDGLTWHVLCIDLVWPSGVLLIYLNLAQVKNFDT